MMLQAGATGVGPAFCSRILGSTANRIRDRKGLTTVTSSQVCPGLRSSNHMSSSATGWRWRLSLRRSRPALAFSHVVNAAVVALIPVVAVALLRDGRHGVRLDGGFLGNLSWPPG